MKLNGIITIFKNDRRLVRLTLIYGILLAFGMTYPEERMFIFPLPVPIKAKWFVIGYAAIEVGLALMQSGDGVAHVAHLGGMLFGYLLIRYWRKTSSDAYQQRIIFKLNRRNELWHPLVI